MLGPNFPLLPLEKGGKEEREEGVGTRRRNCSLSTSCTQQTRFVCKLLSGLCGPEAQFGPEKGSKSSWGIGGLQQGVGLKEWDPPSREEVVEGERDGEREREREKLILLWD